MDWLASDPRRMYLSIQYVFVELIKVEILRILLLACSGISQWKVHHVLRHMGMCTTPKVQNHRKVEEMAYLYIHHHMSTDDIGLAYEVYGVCTRI